MADDLGSLIAKLACDITDLKKGLLEGKGELAGFRQLAEEAGKKVKEALAFVGISLGLYEIISKLKEFSSSVLEVGGKAEILRASADAIGRNFGVSSGAIDIYVQKLRELGIEQEKALYSINAFLKAGLSIDYLPALAQAAKNLAPSMAMPFNEAFQNIVQGVVKGTPKQLAELVPGIKQVMQAAGNETKKIMDQAVLSGPERAQIMLDYILQAAQQARGAGDAVADSYLAKLAEYKRKVLEVKEALFEFVKPIGIAITQEEIKSWDDFYGAIGNNKAALRDLGDTVAVYVGKIAGTIRSITEFAAKHQDLLLLLLQIKSALMVIKWTGIEAGIGAIDALLVKIGILRVALVGPWAIPIVVSIIGADYALKKIKELGNAVKAQGTDTSMLERWGFQRPKTDAELAGSRELKTSEVPEVAALGQRLAQAQEAINRMSREEATDKSPLNPEQKVAKAKDDADQAAADEKKRQAAMMGAGKGGGKGSANDLLGEYLKALEAERQAELQFAQNSLDLLKATNSKKKVELEKNLSEGLIDGQAYYQRLQDLQQTEVAAALAMIDRKREAQRQAYQDALANLNDQDLSAEAKAIAEQRLAADFKKHMAVLDSEAAKTRLEGEKQVIEELKRQVEARQQSIQKTEDLNLETSQLLGTITDQEAKLQRLTLDWQRAKQEAIKRGASPEELAALDSNLTAKQFDVKYGSTLSSISGEFSSGLTNIINGIRQGTMDITKTLTDMFNNIMMAALKPGFEALGQTLTSAVKWLLNSLSSALGGGNLFGGGGGSGGGGGESLIGISNAYSWPSAHGNAFYHGARLAFATGGIVTRPTLFPMANGMGLMGEAGAEGILPLARVGGDLGVKALIGKAGPTQVNIINKTGTEAQGRAQMNDDGSLDVWLEKKISGMVNRGGDLRNSIKALNGKW